LRNLVFDFPIKAFFLLIFLKLFVSFNTNASNLDSLKAVAHSTKSVALKVDVLNKIVVEYLSSSSSKNKDSIEFYAQNALILSQNNNYLKGEADALYYFGKFELSQNVADKAMLYFIRSLTLYQQLKNEEGIAACNLQLGLVSYLTQSYLDAINFFNNTLDNDQVSKSSFALKNYLCALSYAEIDSSNKAKQLFGVALDVYTALGDTEGILQCNTFIGKLYINQGKSDEAISLLSKTLNNIRQIKTTYPEYPIKAFLSSAYLQKKNYAQAIKIGLEAYKESVNGSLIYHKEATKSLYNAYQETGDVKNAFYFLRRLNNLNDSVYNNNTMQKIGEMKSQMIFEQEMRIQKTELEKKEALSNAEKRRIRVVVLGVSIALIIATILLLVLYKNSKEKQRTFKLLQDQNKLIVKEQQRSNELLLNILPEQTALELIETGKAQPRSFSLVTVMFTDFKNFTQLSEKLSPEALIEEINYCYTQFDAIITRNNIEKIKTIGDSYMCAGGLPVMNDNNPKDVVNAAIEIRDFMVEEKNKRAQQGKEFFEIRIGINSGPVVAGIVGVKKFAYDIWGDTVNIASRIESSSEPGKINISENTYQYIKHEFDFEPRGKIFAKNKGEIDMYFVERKKDQKEIKTL
jgi:adenylate cyclase